MRVHHAGRLVRSLAYHAGERIAFVWGVRYLFHLFLGLQLASLVALAETHSQTGHIVNAKCQQAAEIVSRNSRGYSPSGGVNSFTGSTRKAVQSPGKRRAILRHCPVNPGTTEFALLTDNGNFFRLDETGNLEVLAQTESTEREIRVTVTGEVDRDFLVVDSLEVLQARSTDGE
jgi:hypothetical protein